MEYRLVARCQPGGAPPREWLDYCNMGPSVLLYSQELQAKQKATGGTKQRRGEQELPSPPTSPSSPWILEHMQRISDEFWREKLVKQPWEDPDFAVAEFCQMVRSMMILDDSKRANISLVAAHEFWRASGFGDGNLLVEGSS